jgi:hypothetical protein
VKQTLNGACFPSIHSNPDKPDDAYNANNFFYRGLQQFSKNNVNSRVDYTWRAHSFYATGGIQKGNILMPRS